MSEQTTEQTKKDIFQNAVLLSFSLTGITLNRKGDKEEITTGANKFYVGLNKQILDSPEFSAIRHADGIFRRWLKARSMPSYFKAGMYLVRLDKLQEIIAGIKTFAEITRPPLIDKFIQSYPERKEEIKKQLGPQYNEQDYIRVDRIKDFFTVEYFVAEFSTPTSLKRLGDNVHLECKQQLEDKWKVASEEMENFLRMRFVTLVEHFVDILTPDEDGKPKKFQSTFFDTFKGFISEFSDRDILGDTALEGFVNEAKRLMAQLEKSREVAEIEMFANSTRRKRPLHLGEHIRNNSDCRDYIQTQFAHLKDNIQGLVKKQGRQFNFQPHEVLAEEFTEEQLIEEFV